MHNNGAIINTNVINQSGIGMLETLISITILTISTLALVTLQTKAVKSQHHSLAAAIANNLSNNIIDGIHTDLQINLSSQQYWQQQAQKLLPNGNAVIIRKLMVYKVIVSWQLPQQQPQQLVRQVMQ